MLRVLAYILAVLLSAVVGWYIGDATGRVFDFFEDRSRARELRA